MYDLKFLGRMQPATKPNGFKYQEYVLICANDILAVSARAQEIMESLMDIYCFKEDPDTKKKYAPPTCYLDANIGKYAIPDDGRGEYHWYMISGDCVKEASGMSR